ncbi:ABC transporter ATP-binding protein [Nevskia soli]|jgi:iron complex transport system ATP-binding protein|uniref:ABC transporter ATP-binding protein n=1 Tax=Nevskia soli TaxID=418856 RepID=UPI0015D82DC9|nr:ABC transporter ATP-binding protein [Nevskia soli]
MRGRHAALSNLNLTIARGESVAILGPNGCGKSTLIGAILREFYPLAAKESGNEPAKESGKEPAVRILGRDLWNLEELRALIGIVKNNLLPPKAGVVSARELVVSSFFGSVGLWNHQQPTAAMWRAADEALERTRASHLADRDIDELSSGEARRVEIARALAHRPGTLLLDEPANHLDPRAQAELRTLVRDLIREGTAIIMVTHHVADVVPEIGRIILMRSGAIYADGSRREILRSEVLSALFDHPIAIGDS